MSLKFLYITNEIPIIAKLAKIDSVRIFVDAEYLGKSERQKHLNMHLSSHAIDDVKTIKNIFPQVEVMVRINPVHEKTAEEVDLAVASGTDMIMLPMFKGVQEVEKFLNAVDNRVNTCLLFETAASLARIDSILELAGINEAYIGLNDMSLSLELTFLFEVLSGGLVGYMGEKFSKKGIPWGFGGLAKLGQGKIPAELVLAEHIRLGSSRVILSQAFRDNTDEDFDLTAEIKNIANVEEKMQAWSKKQLEDSSQELVRRIREIVG